ncbi:MAG: DNA polymerase III subunit delta', partial [Nitrosomonas sp.]
MHDIYAWQQAIWQKLTQKRQLRGHALLLKGKQGIGKYQFARYFAKALLCTAPTTEQKACGKCLSCGWFEQQAHPNFFQIMPEALAAGSSDSGEKEDSEEKSNSAATKKNASKQISI